jgi:hypothetical protein
MRASALVVICLALLAALLCSSSAAQTVVTDQNGGGTGDSQNPTSSSGVPSSVKDSQSVESAGGDFPGSLYLKVQLDAGIKVAKVKPGDVIIGKLCQAIYSGDREVFPAGSVVHLTVDRLERQHRTPNDHWPWVIKAFTPRHETRPVIQSASVVLSDKEEVPLQVRVISIGNEKEVHSSAKEPAALAKPVAIASVKPTQQAPKKSKKKTGPVVVLEGMRSGTQQEAIESRLVPGFSSGLIAAGTPARIILLGDVTASKNHPGDSVQARLIEPVRIGSTIVLPEGSLFRGEVVKSQPPRMLSRSGWVMLKFTTLSLPGG